MKLILLTVGLIACSSLFAQKSTSKKVKTQYLNIPNYDVTNTDVASLSAFFATGNTAYGAKKLKDIKAVCVVKGGSIKDAKELTTYYYEHDVTRPPSYLFLKDGEGNAVYASEISKGGSDKADFGKEKCEFWIKTNLDKKYTAGKASWERSEHGAYISSEKEKASALLKSNGLVSYSFAELEVYSAKGKGLDYTELDKAFELAMTAYEAIEKSGISKKSFDQLGEAIVIWDTELEKADMENKDARINKKVAQGILMNLTMAHMFRYEMEKASIAAQKADQSFGNFTNNARTEFQNLRVLANQRKTGVDKNTALIADLAALHQKAMESQSIKLQLQDYAEGIDAAKTEYYRFSGGQMQTISANAQEANLAAGGTNYDKYVMPNSLPKSLSIMKLQETLETFPVEITQIEGLAVVTISNNDMASIPSEIGNMESLKKLYIAKNQISELPAEIGNCKKLTHLNLSGNPISKLPTEIKGCDKLKSLNLKGTQVSAEHAAEIQKWLPDCKIKM